MDKMWEEVDERQKTALRDNLLLHLNELQRTKQRSAEIIARLKAHLDTTLEALQKGEASTREGEVAYKKVATKMAELEKELIEMDGKLEDAEPTLLPGFVFSGTTRFASGTMERSDKSFIPRSGNFF